MTTIINPILTPYLGPHIIYPHNLTKQVSRHYHEHQVMKELIAQIPRSKMQNIKCHPDLSNVMPIALSGYWHHAKYTYRIEKTDRDQIYDAMKASVRTDIKKAKLRYTCSQKIDTQILYTLNEKTFARKNKKTPFSQDLVNRIVQSAERRNSIRQYTIYEGELAVCSSLILNDKDCSYCLLIGVDKSRKPQGAVQWMLWEAIKDTISDDRIFDFEGTMIPEVEPVFRAFGGKLRTYSVLTKTNRFLGAAFRLLKGHPF